MALPDNQLMDRPGSHPDFPSEETAPRLSAQLTLALRIAQRNRLRALRAERLARLRPVEIEPEASQKPGGFGVIDVHAPAQDISPRPWDPAEGQAADEALENFLRDLPVEAPVTPQAPTEAADVLPFERPAAEIVEPPARIPEVEKTCDLGRLAGTGPGLIWALRRGGVHDLETLAEMTEEDLVARLGPLGRLVPARAWIATARALREGWKLSD